MEDQSLGEDPNASDGTLCVAAMGSKAVGKRGVLEPTKILQSSSRCSMLLYSAKKKKYFSIGCDTINPLQHLERTTAECLWGAWNRRDAVSEAAGDYDDRVRIVAEDGAGSNFRNEQFIGETRGPAWDTIENSCESHLEALTLKAHGNTIEADVTGQIHRALAMNANTSRYQCRRIVNQVAKEWFKVVRGPPPPCARKNLRFLLRISLTGERRRCEKELSVLYLPNSDPYVHGSLIVYVPEGAIVDEGQMLKLITNSLYDLLYDVKQVPIKRHRWRGLFEGTGRSALMDGLWGFGIEVTKRMFRQNSSIRVRAVCDAAGPRAIPGGRSVDDDVSEAGVGTAASFQIDKEKHRRQGLDWIDTTPYPRMTISKTCLEPVRIHQEQHSKLNRSSSRRKSVIDEIISADVPKLREAVPFYKIISGELERDLDMRLHILLSNDEFWEDSLPAEHKTIEHQVLAFDLCNVAGALSLENLGARRLQTPQSVFSVDILPENEEFICSLPLCRRTSWADKHIKEHLGDVSPLAKQHGRAKRIHIAHNSTLTIETLESLHASIRRRLLSVVQTVGFTLDMLNSTWVVDRFRCRQKSMTWGKQVPLDDDADDNVGETQCDQRAGIGGGTINAFNAFVRERTFSSGQTPTLKVLHEEYGQVDDATKQRLRLDAQDATNARRAGDAKPLGPKQRDIDRGLARRSQSARVDQVASNAIQLAQVSDVDRAHE